MNQYEADKAQAKGEILSMFDRYNADAVESAWVAAKRQRAEEEISTWSDAHLQSVVSAFQTLSRFSGLDTSKHNTFLLVKDVIARRAAKDNMKKRNNP